MLNLLLNYIFISLVGYKAAAYTTFGCYTFNMIIHWIAVIFLLKKNNYERTYNLKAIIIAESIGIVWMIVVEALFEKGLLRFVFITIIAIILYIFRTRLKPIFEEILIGFGKAFDS